MSMPIKLSYDTVKARLNPRIVAGASVLAVAMVVSSQIIHMTSLVRADDSVTTSADSSPKKVFLSSAATPASTSSRTGTMLGLNIANNGLVLVRDARILSIAPYTFTASLSWGSENFTWSVRVPYNTKFIHRDGKAGVLADLKEGDTVTITGQLDTNATEPTINAQYVRY